MKSATNKAGRPVKAFGTHETHARNVWKLAYGAFPDGEIDHINRDPSDNRLENLRVCTRSENNRNRRTYSTNTSGHKGVWLDKKAHKWQVRVKAGAERVFACASHKISAIVAARLIRRVLHGAYACDK